MLTSFHLPTRIVAGEGSLETLPIEARALGIARPMVFTDPVLAQTAVVQRAIEGLAQSGLDVVLFDDCAVDARTDQVDAQATRISARGCDGVIGLGGGSVICAAKGAAIAAANGGRVAALRGRLDLVAPAPMIMVPTTAGSGSEVSQWTLVRDTETQTKFSVGGPSAFPRLAILDPETLVSLPEQPAAMAGLDALSHAIEALFTVHATPLTDAVALASVGMMVRAIRPALHKRDLKALMDMHHAATMANVACGSARLGLCHALSMPLEGAFDLPHALGVAALLPPVVAFNAQAAPSRASDLAAAFGLGAPADPGATVAAAIRELLSDLGIPSRLTTAQVDTARLPEMAARSVTALSRGVQPEGPITGSTQLIYPGLRSATVDDGVELYKASMDPEGFA